MTKSVEFYPNGPAPEPNSQPVQVPIQNPTSWEHPNKRRQYIAALTAGMLYVASGTTLAWFFPVLYNWIDRDAAVVLTYDLSWIQALLFLGGAIGTIPGVLLADRLGRRITLLILAVMFVLGWVLIAVESNAPICIGRFLHGLATGAAITVVPLYASEISEDDVRPILMRLLYKFLLVGLLLTFFIGQMVPYLALALMSALIPIAYIAAFYFLPESPFYLITKERPEQARLALQWLLQKQGEQVQPVIDSYQIIAREIQTSYRDLIGTSDLTRALLVMLALVVCQQMSGICFEFFYSSLIFKSLGGTVLVAVSAIITWSTVVLASFFQRRIEERLGRKKLLFYSAIGMAISQALVAIFFTVDTTALAFLGVIGVLGFLAMFFIGFGPIPLAFTKDSFPKKMWSKATTVMLTCMWFMVFLIGIVLWNVGHHTQFWIFSVSCAFAAVFVYFVIPETKDNPVLMFKDEEEPEVLTNA